MVNVGDRVRYVGPDGAVPGMKSGRVINVNGGDYLVIQLVNGEPNAADIVPEVQHQITDANLLPNLIVPQALMFEQMPGPNAANEQMPGQQQEEEEAAPQPPPIPENEDSNDNVNGYNPGRRNRTRKHRKNRSRKNNQRKSRNNRKSRNSRKNYRN